ncbi:MAG: exonuclease domain-containing protein [Candidatus Moranbacteria bacterium]|nr:exonuclease domain-containing protein [Candidatus Moranbacteria bacterium]
MNRNKLIFLDTETTGLGPDARLCQVAYKFNGEEKEFLFKPPVPIEIEAMSVSHITNRMVEDKEEFHQSETKKELENIFSEGNIMVAHNAKFDATILEREKLLIDNMIDTQKIAQHLDEEGEIPKYNLQYLRYYFDLDVRDAVAHNALGDVRVLESIFDYFFEKMIHNLEDEKRVIEEMILISSRPVLIKKFNFGKYAGEKVSDVAQKDTGYLRWLLGEKIKSREQGVENDEDWIHTLEYYLN